MTSVAHLFREGGYAMFLILVLDLLGMLPVLAGLVGAIVFRARGKSSKVLTVLLVVLLATTLLPFLAGLVGHLQGRSMVEQALAYASPEHVEALRAQGMAEAALPLYFGGISTVFYAVLAGVALLLAPRAKPVEIEE